MSISLTKITQFSGHKEAIYTLVYNKVNKKALSAGGDGYIVEWDIYGKGDGNAIADLKETIYSICIKEESNILYAVTRSGMLHCIDLVKNTIFKKVLLSSSPLFSICLKGEFIYVGDEKGSVFKLDMDCHLVSSAKFGDKSIRQIVPSANSLYLATSSNNIYEIDSSLTILDTILRAHENSIFCCTPTEKELWTGGRDAILKIWKANELNKEIIAHNLHINSLDFNKTNSLVLSGSMDKSVKIWDSTSHKLLKVINKEKCDFHISSVNKVLWIGSNEFISCGDDRKVIYTEIDIK